MEGGTPFAFQLDAEGKPCAPCAVYVTRPNGARVVVLAEGMAAMFLDSTAGERLTSVPRDPGKTIYLGRDSALFMEEVLAWLAKNPPVAGVSALPAGRSESVNKS